VFGGGLHLSVTDSVAAQNTVREAIQAKGIEVRALQPIDPSMEDVFVAMIEREDRRLATA
jgi:ABC-2 type transport system ATP-binding protein